MATGTGTHFNSHARVGRDGLGGIAVSVGYDFNSHARVGRDGNLLGHKENALKFQLTRPCRA